MNTEMEKVRGKQNLYTWPVNKHDRSDIDTGNRLTRREAARLQKTLVLPKFLKRKRRRKKEIRSCSFRYL
jgi:hypothetical protein